MVQSERFPGRFLRPLLKTGLSLMKNVLKLLIKSVLIPLALTAAASIAHAEIHTKILESWMTTLIISKEEMIDITKIVKFLEESNILIKDIRKTIKNYAKEH